MLYGYYQLSRTFIVLQTPNSAKLRSLGLTDNSTFRLQHEWYEIYSQISVIAFCRLWRGALQEIGVVSVIRYLLDFKLISLEDMVINQVLYSPVSKWPSPRGNQGLCLHLREAQFISFSNSCTFLSGPVASVQHHIVPHPCSTCSVLNILSFALVSAVAMSRRHTVARPAPPPRRLNEYFWYRLVSYCADATVEPSCIIVSTLLKTKRKIIFNH